MALDGQDLSRLLGLLYEGLAHSDRFSEFLDEAARQLRCDKAAIVFHDSENRSPRMGFFLGLSDQARTAYENEYGRKNPIVPCVFREASNAGAWSGLARAIVDEHDYERSEYYQGWGREAGVYHAVLGMAAHDRRRFTSLSVMRGPREGALGEDAVELMDALVPHLQRAFQINGRLKALDASLEFANAALDVFDTGVIFIDAAGKVVRMNRAGESLLREGDGLELCQGRLAASEGAQSATFERLIREAARTGGGSGLGSGGDILLKRLHSDQPLAVTVAPFRSSHLLTEESPAAVVFVSDAQSRPASRTSLMSTLYGLTPAECRLAERMLNGLELRQAAEELGITFNTARSALKIIFAKTGARGQTELVRLMLSLPGSIQR